VLLRDGAPLSYDYLLIGTGPKVDYDYIPGLREHSHSIVTYLTAEPFAAHYGIGGFGNAQKMCE